MLKRLEKLDIPIIYFTAAIVLLSGFSRIINFKLSDILLNYGLLPYIFIRGFFYIFVLLNKKRRLSRTEQTRLVVYIAVLITFILSVLNIFSADFFLIFLIMIEYLLIVNSKKVA